MDPQTVFYLTFTFFVLCFVLSFTVAWLIRWLRYRDRD